MPEWSYNAEIEIASYLNEDIIGIEGLVKI